MSALDVLYTRVQEGYTAGHVSGVSSEDKIRRSYSAAYSVEQRPPLAMVMIVAGR